MLRPISDKSCRVRAVPERWPQRPTRARNSSDPNRLSPSTRNSIVRRVSDRTTACSRRKRVIVLGSTGSIGRNALDVAAHLEDEIEIVGLAADRNWQALADQARCVRPRAVAIANRNFEAPLRSALQQPVASPIAIFSGDGALTRLVRELDADFVLAAVVGAAGLPSTLAAVELGRTIGLANKETLVVAGCIVTPLAARSGATLIPIDSEHSAVFQALHAGRQAEVEKIYLTASGGPFRTWNSDQIRQATLDDALKHPTWSMGPKITIDSATMMNKALEIIEARWLFDIPPDRIDVVIHPESIVHSMVQFHDGSVVAQMGPPDMRTPIQYALTYPHRRFGRTDRLDLPSIRRMHFEPPDPERFPALRLGHEVAAMNGTAGAALNAANEAAVEAFRSGQLRFHEIVPTVEEVLRRHCFEANPNLDQLMEVDAWARREVMQCCSV